MVESLVFHCQDIYVTVSLGVHILFWTGDATYNVSSFSGMLVSIRSSSVRIYACTCLSTYLFYILHNVCYIWDWLISLNIFHWHLVGNIWLQTEDFNFLKLSSVSWSRYNMDFFILSSFNGHLGFCHLWYCSLCW